MSDGESIAGREREVTFHTSSALTREQVEEVFNAVYWHGDQQGAKQCKVLDGIDALRATIEQQAQELERATEVYTIAHRGKEDMRQQLAASQARCREMEKQYVHQDLLLDEQDKVAQLQATLAAREAERDELKYRLQVHADLIGETEHSLRTQLAALRLTWTTARPTVAGWYWWRCSYCTDGETCKYITRIYEVEDSAGGVFIGGIGSPDKLGSGEWAGPIPMPDEAQQASGSSGGAANRHGAGT